MSVLPGRNQGWRNYWKEDRNESCVAENDTTAMAIRERWIELFSDLADSSRILDVATGNGALLAHAAIAAEPDLGSAHLLRGRVLAARNALERFLIDRDEDVLATRARAAAQAFQRASELGHPLDELSLAWNDLSLDEFPPSR